MNNNRRKTSAFTQLRLVLVVFLGFCTPLSIWAQEEVATGLIENDSTYESQPLMLAYDGSKALDLPAKVTLKSYCPTAGNQGMVQSCVGWSIGYAAYTIERAVQNRWTEAAKVNAEASSAMFIYNSVKEGVDCRNAKADMAKTMNWLKSNGDCLAKEFDNRVEDCDKKPTAAVSQSAKKFVLSDCARLFSPNDKADFKTNQIRGILAKNKPVVISLNVTASFQKAWNKEFWLPLAGEKLSGFHALTVVGYDDATGHFLLFNSWGIGWGQNGFIKVKYADLAEKCRYAYAIFLEKSRFKSLALGEKIEEETPSVSEPRAKSEPDYDLVEMGGKLEINQFKGRSELGELLFEPVELDFMGDHYALRKDDFKVGDVFQLALTSTYSGAYVYVLSLNPKNEAKVLFPRDEAFNEKFAGRHESPLIVFEGSRVILPSPQSGMKVEFVGTDRICLLFSLKKITNLPKICTLLEDSGDNFIKKLHSLLGSHMIPLAETHFNDDDITFSTATRSGAAVMPIIIECRAQ